MGRRHRLRVVALAVAIDFAFFLMVGLLEGAGCISERFSGACAGVCSLGNLLLILRWAFDDDDDRPARGAGSAAAPALPLKRPAPPRLRALADLSSIACIGSELLRGARLALRAASRATLGPTSHEV